MTSAITKCAGMWQLYVICKTTQIDEKATIIDLTANNSAGEHIFISDAINGRISGNEIDIEAFENIAVDENIKILYDDILSLKLRVEKNEATRQSQENTRQTAEANRANAESQRVSAEQSRVDNEGLRTQSEASRSKSEASRTNAENKRVEAENARVNAETSRGTEENKRVDAEKSRVSAESLRVSAENERVKSETFRKQSEQTRNDNEQSRQSAERTRVSEENARKQAETARVSAEQSRVTVESQRVNAEDNRVNAERARSEAESNRVNAEQSRVDAEKLRVTADTDRTNKTNTALKTLEDAVESEREKYSQHFFENAFALQRTGKVYTVKFPLWKTSHLAEGEKLDDNAGLVLEPSTKTIRGRNDYKDIPLFKTYDVNAYVDDDGVRHVTAIKGDRNFQDTGKNDVFVLGMSYYEKTWADDQYWYYSRTDIPKDGYTIARECINRDGTAQPYTLCAKYVSSMIDGVYYSTKGQAPARACSNPKDNITSVDNSYYGLIRNCKKKGAFYTGGLMCDYKSILTSQQLMLGTTVPKAKIWGCTSCWGEPVASIQSADKHSYFPVKKTDADNYPVGCGVSVGYKHLNNDGTSTLDRAYAEAHAYANDVKVLKKEPLDDNNVAIYLDIEEPFNTMPVQLSDTVTSEIYILSMHWRSGFSDDVLDRYGCPCEDKSGLTSGRYPMVWQGVELMVGGYETFANAFMDIVNLTTRDVYITNDATQLTNNDEQAKNTYKKLPYQMSVAKNSQWNYVTEIKLDLENGAFVQTQSGQDGSSSATGFGDAIYFNGATSETREFLSLGCLGSGSAAGLACCFGGNWLGYAHWDVLARQSDLN
ncbi:hypothetical protein [Catenibacterium mitsuokai]|uniref:hypothetical protein n=1 Tax=Catenibacterium mitsuokai TaxID=100886 RepID=UPI002E7A2066|nr:hypothetical protein [Catenibacterium mitsuokai]